MILTKKKRCPVCLRIFEVARINKQAKGVRVKQKRGCNCITCSKKCSFVYNRCISKYLNNSRGKKNDTS